MIRSSDAMNVLICATLLMILMTSVSSAQHITADFGDHGSGQVNDDDNLCDLSEHNWSKVVSSVVTHPILSMSHN